jgi:hypothetical protein
MGTGGDIFRYGLDDWWLSEFSASEREQIADTYRPMGMSGRPLVEGSAIRQPDLHPGPFLANLATWVAKPMHGDLALRIAEKAASFDTLPSDLSQAHFMFANLCKVFYVSETPDPMLWKRLSGPASRVLHYRPSWTLDAWGAVLSSRTIASSSWQ